MAFPDSFSTPRLRAERLTEAHLPELLRMHRDAAVMKHLGGVRDERQTSSYLARNLRHWTEYGYGLWILHERDGADPIGRTVLRHLLVDGVDEVEVGYAFYPDFWGRGLASEATAACLEFARRPLHLESIVALTSPDNAASQRVLRKAGLVYEREVVHDGLPSSLFRIRFPGD